MSDLPMVGIINDKAGQHPLLLQSSGFMLLTTPCLSVLSHLLDSNATKTKDETRNCNKSFVPRSSTTRVPHIRVRLMIDKNLRLLARLTPDSCRKS
jgi:hypothetical protein